MKGKLRCPPPLRKVWTDTVSMTADGAKIRKMYSMEFDCTGCAKYVATKHAGNEPTKCAKQRTNANANNEQTHTHCIDASIEGEMCSIFCGVRPITA
jgi:hypothetical protein